MFRSSSLTRPAQHPERAEEIMSGLLNRAADVFLPEDLRSDESFLKGLRDELMRLPECRFRRGVRKQLVDRHLAKSLVQIGIGNLGCELRS